MPSRACRILMLWIKENLGPLMASPTDPIDGEVVIGVN
jgi:hypothetical protein